MTFNINTDLLHSECFSDIVKPGPVYFVLINVSKVKSVPFPQYSNVPRLSGRDSLSYITHKAVSLLADCDTVGFRLAMQRRFNPSAYLAVTSLTS